MQEGKQPQGLYRPSFEHDACGIGALVQIKGVKSHQIVQDALSVLVNMEHRGGKGLEENTGDGAGILFQIPHRFFRQEAQRQGHLLPDEGDYGVAMLFLAQDKADALTERDLFGHVLAENGLSILFWRKVPINPTGLGMSAKASMPAVYQAFVTRPEGTERGDAFERKLYIARRLVEKKIKKEDQLTDKTFYVVSMSCRTIIYKGMLVATQLNRFYPDLNQSRVESSLALVHSRFSTNTNPSWERAHPYRYMIHNGEINTLRGNVNMMQAREKNLYSGILGEDLSKILPVIDGEGSDSAIMDNVLEFLSMSGRSLARSAMMLMPEPWVHDHNMNDKLRAFLAYQSTLMEPWDGPAAVVFTNGIQTGAILDRNGLRPARYYLTKDDRLILASEVGVLDIDPAQILQKGNLEPGRMIMVDPEQGRILWNDEIKEGLANEQPYRQWIDEELVQLDQLEDPAEKRKIDLSYSGKSGGMPVEVATPYDPSDDDAASGERLLRDMRVFGYSYEDMTETLQPMAEQGSEPTTSMGTDVPLAVLSDHPKPLYDYFKQLFAQVTNPPIDAMREFIVTSTQVYLGTSGNLLEDSRDNCRLLRLKSPLLTAADFRKIRNINARGFRAQVFRTVFDRDADPETGLEKALTQLNRDVQDAVEHHQVNIIILSDVTERETDIPIPSLLAVSSVHQHLIRVGLRTKADLVAETGDLREVHHAAMLVGYGASSIYPYLAHAAIRDMAESGKLKCSAAEGIRHYNEALVQGIVKVMSKMGISTIHSYHGSQIFEALGISQPVVEKYFTNTVSRIGGLGIGDIQREAVVKYDLAQEAEAEQRPGLESSGETRYRTDKEDHLYDPMTVQLLQKAVRSGDTKIYKQYSSRFNEGRVRTTLRSYMDFVPQSGIPIEEVEPAAEIVKRFKTGAMSYGSISQEAHETLAIAMNRLKGKSNSGEGGEDVARERLDANGDSKLSAIKQVASGRFGVSRRGT